MPLGEWVLATAGRDVRAMQLELGRPLTAAVNISPRQFQKKSLPHDFATLTDLAPFDGLHWPHLKA